MKTICVIAGNGREFMQFMEEIWAKNPVKPEDRKPYFFNYIVDGIRYRFVSSVHVMMGLRNVEYVYYGSYRSRRDIADIGEEVLYQTARENFIRKGSYELGTGE